MTWAWTSTARSVAAVSVVKYGLPVPATITTTRPFSRWRTARRRMYGSQISFMAIALITRVGQPDLLERVLEGQAVHDGGQHAHVVARRAVHALARWRPARGRCCRRRPRSRSRSRRPPRRPPARRSRARRRDRSRTRDRPCSASPDSFSSTRRRGVVAVGGGRSVMRSGGLVGLRLGGVSPTAMRAKRATLMFSPSSATFSVIRSPICRSVSRYGCSSRHDRLEPLVQLALDDHRHPVGRAPLALGVDREQALLLLDDRRRERRRG